MTPVFLKEGISMAIDVTIQSLYALEHTLAKEYLEGFVHPWEALSGIGDLIRALGPTLDPEVYEQTAPQVWVAKSACVAPTATILPPTIVGPGTDIRPGAFIRGCALIGQRVVVGNSTELKNVILFDEVQVPHYNYVGDSILGYRAHLGAGAITSNFKADHSKVSIKAPGGLIWETGRNKVGAMLGDRAEVGCNSVLNPGTVIGRDTIIYPLSSIRGVIPGRHIYKRQDVLVIRK